MANKVNRLFTRRHTRYVRRCTFSAFLCRDCGCSIRRVKYVSVDLCPDCLRSANATLHQAHHS